MKTEILFNDELNNYTLKQEILVKGAKNGVSSINGVKSYKKVPLKYKPDDTTAKFRQELIIKKFT